MSEIKNQLVLIVPLDVEIASIESSIDYHTVNENYEKAANLRDKIINLRKSGKDIEHEVSLCNRDILKFTSCK